MEKDTALKTQIQNTSRDATVTTQWESVILAKVDSRSYNINMTCAIFDIVVIKVSTLPWQGKWLYSDDKFFFLKNTVFGGWEGQYGVVYYRLHETLSLGVVQTSNKWNFLWKWS